MELTYHEAQTLLSPFSNANPTYASSKMSQHSSLGYITMGLHSQNSAGILKS